MKQSLELYSDGCLYEIEGDHTVKVTGTQGQVDDIITALKFSTPQTSTIAPPGKQPLDVIAHRGSRRLNDVGFKLLTTFDIRNTATLALQRLWNRNDPGAQIAKDVDYGSNTESKSRISPVNGFKISPWDKLPRLLKLSQPRIEGSSVERLQGALKKAGIAVGVDGEFEPGTDKAVNKFQKKKSLTPDSIGESKTLAVIA